MAEPIAVPALVPALDEHAAEAVVRREVDILLRPPGRRAMLGAFGPAPVAADHPPPDADVFHRLAAADVDRKCTRPKSSHYCASRVSSSARTKKTTTTITH